MNSNIGTKLRNLLYMVSVLALTYPVALLSQTDKPDNFYKKNYVGGVLKESDKKRVYSNHTGIQNTGKNTGSNSQVNTRLNNSANKDDGVPIESVTLLVNGLDQQHTTRQLIKLSEIMLVSGISISDIYILGPYNSAPVSGYLKLLTLGGARVHMDGNFPARFRRFNKSPTWLVGTTKGAYYLEGVEQFDNFVTPEGLFIPEPDISGGSPLAKRNDF